MQFGLDIAQQRVPFADVIDRAQFAESLGFTGVWGFDHFVAMYGDPPPSGMTEILEQVTRSSVMYRPRAGALPQQRGAP